MGVNELFQAIRSRFVRKDQYPGSSVHVLAKGMGGREVEAELYNVPGVLSMPAPDARLVMIPVGGSDRSAVFIAGHHYGLSLSPASGECIIYSMDATGAKARIHCKATGEIEMIAPTADVKIQAENLSVEADVDVTGDTVSIDADVEITNSGSLDVDGDVTGGGDATFDGEVIWDNASTPTHASTHTHPTTLGPSGPPIGGT